MSKRSVTFRVTFTLPEDATIKDAREYVTDAVRAWRGSLKPASACEGHDDWFDVMFYLDPDSVRVVLGKSP